MSKKEETETLPFAAEFALSLRTVDDPTVLSQFPASKLGRESGRFTNPFVWTGPGENIFSMKSSFFF